jgi:hypothetical protein
MPSVGVAVRTQELGLEGVAAQAIGQQLRALAVGVTGRIDGGDPHQVGGEADHLVARLVDLAQRPDRRSTTSPASAISRRRTSAARAGPRARAGSC